VTDRELYVVISKRVPKKLIQQLEKALKARLGDLYEIKVTTG
jgi:predicted regulator of amino acid metabolism with ACT domain